MGILLITPTAYAGTTFLPIKSQNMVILNQATYAPRAVDIQAIQHLDIDLSLAIKDGSNTYTGVIGIIDFLYPYYGNSATTHQYNLINTATFRLIDHNSPTHSAVGVVYNGTTQYSDTTYNPGVQLPTIRGGLFMNSQTNASPPGVMIGAFTSSPFSLTALDIDTSTGNNYSQFSGNSAAASLGLYNMTGFWAINAKNAGGLTLYKNGVSIGPVAGAVASKTPGNLFVGAENQIGTAVAFSGLHTDFAGLFNTGTSDAQNTEVYNAQLMYNTTLGR
jgi:hypothetical protein